MPPIGNGWLLKSAKAWERVGAALSLPFAGVHIVEATKQVYRAIPARPRTHAADFVVEAGAGASSTVTRTIENKSSPAARPPGRLQM